MSSLKDFTLFSESDSAIIIINCQFPRAFIHAWRLYLLIKNCFIKHNKAPGNRAEKVVFDFLIFQLHKIYMAVIIDYEDKYISDFQRLNLEWLEKFDLVESHDLEILHHPQENVIGRGGFIFLLMEHDAVIGTAGIFKINDQEYELIKMAVAPAHRGKKFGDMLLKKCIAKAKEVKASKMILFSNSNLQTAISLYEKFDFKHVEVTEAPFKTADIKMELDL